MSGDARTTERLMLRPPGPGDGPGYRALLMDPVIGEWLRPQPLRPFEPADGDLWRGEDERHWERFGFGPWAVIERASGDYLGRVELDMEALRHIARSERLNHAPIPIHGVDALGVGDMDALGIGITRPLTSVGEADAPPGAGGEAHEAGAEKSL